MLIHVHMTFSSAACKKKETKKSHYTAIIVGACIMPILLLLSNYSPIDGEWVKILNTVWMCVWSAVVNMQMILVAGG